MERIWKCLIKFVIFLLIFFADQEKGYGYEDFKRSCEEQDLFLIKINWGKDGLTKDDETRHLYKI